MAAAVPTTVAEAAAQDLGIGVEGRAPERRSLRVRPGPAEVSQTLQNGPAAQVALGPNSAKLFDAYRAD